MTVVTTERLILREWTEDPADLARVFDTYSRTEVTRWLAGAGLPLTEPAQAADLVRAWRKRYATDGGRYAPWAIEVRDSGVVAGTVLVKRMPGADGVTPTDDVEVGWHLHPDAWGHGYATEAARAAVAREFAAGSRRVHAVVLPGNEPSMAVCRRLGMTHVGRRADWYGGADLETFVLDALPA